METAIHFVTSYFLKFHSLCIKASRGVVFVLGLNGQDEEIHIYSKKMTNAVVGGFSFLKSRLFPYHLPNGTSLPPSHFCKLMMNQQYNPISAFTQYMKEEARELKLLTYWSTVWPV